MIEIMVIVRDTDTGKREHHVTEVIASAADVTDEDLEDIRHAAETAVTGATRRLRELAVLTDYYSRVAKP
jgi:hypothetical protein